MSKTLGTLYQLEINNNNLCFNEVNGAFKLFLKKNFF